MSEHPWITINDMLVALCQGKKVVLPLPTGWECPPLPEDIRKIINNLRVKQSRTKHIYLSLGLIYEPKTLQYTIDDRMVTLHFEPLRSSKRYVAYIIND